MPSQLEAKKDVASCEKLRGELQASKDPQISEWGGNLPKAS